MRTECVGAHYFFSLTRHPPLNFINTPLSPLALSSATFHSRLETELFNLSYPDSTSAPRHVRNHHRLQPQRRSPTLSPPAWYSLILTWHRNETRSLALRTCHSTGEYKLVSLAWLFGR